MTFAGFFAAYLTFRRGMPAMEKRIYGTGTGVAHDQNTRLLVASSSRSTVRQANLKQDQDQSAFRRWLLLNGGLGWPSWSQLGRMRKQVNGACPPFRVRASMFLDCPFGLTDNLYAATVCS